VTRSSNSWLFRPPVRGNYENPIEDIWYEGSRNGAITVEGYRGDDALDRWADDWEPYKAPTYRRVPDEWETLAEVDPTIGLEDDDVAVAA
jgi:hypothetical protein